MTERYAIYYSPDVAEPLGRLGHGWLGVDPATGDRPLCPAALPEPPEDLTSGPRHYGFHATLKAPFELADRATGDDLLAFARQFAARVAPVTLADGLVVATLGRFLALVPAATPDELGALAGHVVRAFEPYRGPLGSFDLGRRRLAQLTPQQEQNLVDWGYPYVFEEFRFHMTLTPQLDDGARAAWLHRLQAGFAELDGKPVVLDRICVFHQAARTLPFRQIAAIPLGG